MKKPLFTLFSVAALVASAADGVFTVEGVTYSQNQNNRDVTITYTLDCPADRTAEAFVCFDIYTNGVSIGRDKFKTFQEGSAVSRDSRETFVADGTSRTIVWKARKDWPDQKNKAVTVKVFVCSPTETEALAALFTDPHYLVLDLDNNSFYYTFTGPNLADDTCRTSELWMKYVPGAENITLGSPEGELGRGSNEAHYTCSLSGYYLGIFECTQAQWYRVIGNYNRCSMSSPRTRPVDNVVYGNTQNSSTDTLRGDTVYGPGQVVAAASFFGKLNAKFVNAFSFDLPSEAQWEYACRAGTTSALYTGKEVTTTEKEVACANVGEVARYFMNQNSNENKYWANNPGKSAGTDCYTDVVGKKLPNVWGFYDMLGNVYELCRDYYVADRSAVNLQGEDAVNKTPDSSWAVSLRGGCWDNGAAGCRSASRSSTNPKSNYETKRGFRVQCKVK